MRTALIAAVLCSVLCGCGQKGPLFMPSDPAPAGLALSQSSSPYHLR